MFWLKNDQLLVSVIVQQNGLLYIYLVDVSRLLWKVVIEPQAGEVWGATGFHPGPHTLHLLHKQPSTAVYIHQCFYWLLQAGHVICNYMTGLSASHVARLIIRISNSTLKTSMEKGQMLTNLSANFLRDWWHPNSSFPVQIITGISYCLSTWFFAMFIVVLFDKLSDENTSVSSNVECSFQCYQPGTSSLSHVFMLCCPCYNMPVSYLNFHMWHCYFPHVWWSI